MQSNIVPGILVQNYLDIQTQVGQVLEVAPLVQLDICDGVFVQSKTWPYTSKDMHAYQKIINEEDGLPYWSQVNYELDLMVKNAHAQFFTDWLKLGPTHIVFHLEAEDPARFLSFLENLEPFYKETIKIGIAIEVDTDPERITPFIEHISYIQCMGIETIGLQGQIFSQKAIEQIEKIHTLFPEVPITVDGGINEFVLKVLAPHNISRYVVGSALFKSFDLDKTIIEFNDIISKNMIK